jgi:hypothetical protein
MSEYTNRTVKSYNGALMEKGRTGEEIVMRWLSNNPYCREVIDMREFRISQRLDVDCGIETVDGAIVLAEIKTDYNLGRTNNVLFEVFRINHFVSPDKVFYLGWAFRSPAKYLLYYAPHEKALYRFEFTSIRQIIGKYVSANNPRLQVTPTDEQKTTFNILIPFAKLEGKYKKYDLSEGDS